MSNKIWSDTHKMKDTRHQKVFPTTETTQTEHSIATVTQGGYTKLEQAAIMIAQGLAENPLYDAYKMSIPELSVSIANAIFDMTQKQENESK